MQRWVLASSNSGKLREFQHALAGFLRSHDIELVNQSSLGIDSADEPHDSFHDNALAKARHASRFSGLPAMADDSGLCVAALSGAPGVRSARYWEDAWVGGPKAAPEPGMGLTQEDLQSFHDAHRDASTDERNLEWLLNRMQKAHHNAKAMQPSKEVPAAFWNAEFVAAIAFVRDADDPMPLVAIGRWSGRIVLTPQGQGGFGYDPIFFDPELGRTGAQLTVAEKEAVSHRGRALRDLQAQLQTHFLSRHG